MLLRDSSNYVVKDGLKEMTDTEYAIGEPTKDLPSSYSHQTRPHEELLNDIQQLWILVAKSKYGTEKTNT